MPPSMIWMLLFARFLYEEHNLDIKTTDLIQRTLTSEKQKLVKSLENDFIELIGKNLAILDETQLTKQMLSNPLLLQNLYKRIMHSLGDLHFVALDHINQLDLIFPDMGNTGMRTFTSACKTFKNNQGQPLSGIVCCQCNREGNKRANKRKGVMLS